MRRAGAAAAGVLAILAAGCPGGDVAPAREADPLAAIVFVERTAGSGLDSFRQVNGDPEKGWITGSIGGGVAFLDHDGDGDLDAYLTNGSRLGGFPPGEEPRDALFAQEAPGRFVDRTTESGLGDARWTCGVRVADVQGDGRPDLFLTNVGPDALCVNEGGTFVERAAEAGLAHPGWSTGAAFLDQDRDGDLDLYVAQYVDVDMEELRVRKPVQTYRGQQVFFGPRGMPEGQDRFYRQEADGRWTDATGAVGLEGARAYGLGVVVFDYDEDGWVDVYVANDSTPNMLWRNEGGERFVDEAMFAGVALGLDGTPQAGMGIAVGDYDGDCLVDLYVTNFAEDYYTLYRGEGEGLFRDVTSRLDLRTATVPLLGWACGFEDFDDDGDQDLFAVNGHVFPQVDRFALGTSYRQRNSLFVNVEGRLLPAASPRGDGEGAGAGGPGFALEEASRGAAVGDYDGDGRLDLLIGNIDGPPALLRNESPASGHWLEVLLVGRGGNRDAIGARVVAEVGGRRMLRLVGTAAGFLSSSDPAVHFGLGAAERVERLEVVWPDGGRTTLEDVAGDRRVTLDRERGLSSAE